MTAKPTKDEAVDQDTPIDDKDDGPPKDPLATVVIDALHRSREATVDND